MIITAHRRTQCHLFISAHKNDYAEILQRPRHTAGWTRFAQNSSYLNYSLCQSPLYNFQSVLCGFFSAIIAMAIIIITIIIITICHKDGKANGRCGAWWWGWWERKCKKKGKWERTFRLRKRLLRPSIKYYFFLYLLHWTYKSQVSSADSDDDDGWREYRGL